MKSSILLILIAIALTSCDITINSEKNGTTGRVKQDTVYVPVYIDNHIEQRRETML